MALGVDFIRAVDVDRQALDLVAVKHRNAQGFEVHGGGFGAGHRALDLVFHRGQGVDEFVDRGAGAHANDLAG